MEVSHSSKWGPSSNVYFAVLALAPAIVYALASVLLPFGLYGKLDISTCRKLMVVVSSVVALTAQVVGVLYYRRQFDRRFAWRFMKWWPVMCGALLLLFDVIFFILSFEYFHSMMTDGILFRFWILVVVLFIEAVLMPLPLVLKCGMLNTVVHCVGSVFLLTGTWFCAELIRCVSHANLVDSGIDLQVAFWKYCPKNGFLLTFIILLLFGGAYLAHAYFLATLHEKMLYRLFNSGVRTALACIAVLYVLFFFLNIVSTRKFEKVAKKISDKIVRPLTLESLSNMYYFRQKPDGEFWETLAPTAQYASVSLIPKYSSSFLQLPEKEKLLAQYNISLSPELARQMEDAVHNIGEIPKMPLDFSSNAALQQSLYKRADIIRGFTNYTLSELCYALNGNTRDIVRAAALLSNQKKMLDSIYDDPFIISLYAMHNASRAWNAATQIFIQNAKPDEAQLAVLVKEYLVTESRVNAMALRTFQGEAIMTYDFLQNRFAVAGSAPSFDALRWPAPQLYWLFTIMATRRMEAFSKCQSFWEISSCLFDGWKAPAFFITRNSHLRNTGYALLYTIAGDRTTLALLAAELFKCRKGRYPLDSTELFPDFLPAPPTDPFTNDPMFYSIGEALLPVNEWYESSVETSFRTMRAILFLSTGKNRVRDAAEENDDVFAFHALDKP